MSLHDDRNTGGVGLYAHTPGAGDTAILHLPQTVLVKGDAFFARLDTRQVILLQIQTEKFNELIYYFKIPI